MWTCKNRNSMIIYVHTSNGILKNNILFLGGIYYEKDVISRSNFN